MADSISCISYLNSTVTWYTETVTPQAILGKGHGMKPIQNGTVRVRKRGLFQKLQRQQLPHNPALYYDR